MLKWLSGHMARLGIEQEWLAYAALILLYAAGITLLYLLLKWLVGGIARFYAKKTKHNWDDILLKKRFFSRLSAFCIPLAMQALAPSLPAIKDIILRLSELCGLLVLLLVLAAAINAANDIYMEYPISKTRPIKGLLQILKVTLAVVGGIVMLAVGLGESPLVLLGGVGAMTAVLSFVFKDTILNFVAGIQLTGNDMIRIGDLVSLPKYGADGSVIDISLTTVKVQNFDKSITTIPPYTLVSDSFVNWRGMFESGARRIKRAVVLDAASVTVCTEEMLARFANIHLITDYIAGKRQIVSDFNKDLDVSEPANGRRLTNIGTFRAYITAYLRAHPGIRHDMILLVRQLPAEGAGIPLELYAFTDTVVWAEHEGIVADIFDHIYAVAPRFSLRIFQQPTGGDFRGITENRNKEI